MNAQRATMIYQVALRDGDDAVVDVAMSAAQNVVDTLAKPIREGFTGKQAEVFVGSLRDLLSSRDHENARPWFAARGVQV